MLNKVWFGLVLVGVLYGFGKGALLTAFPQLRPAAVDQLAEDRADEAAAADEQDAAADESTPLATIGRKLNDAVFDAAKVSVEIVITLIGAMALWLGVLRIAKDAGLVDALARLLRPALRFLFPDVPDGHPAQGAMLMNIAANMLGLDNAATPMGLKAMKELQTLNPRPDTATNAQAMFLAINTSSVTLIPFTIIAYRKAAHSATPESPIFGILLATTVSTTVAILAAKWLAKRPRYAVDAPSDAPAIDEEAPQS
ncbi:MAG: hypothetical protein KDA44_06450 [Planctomycetales bacterium]|nr:hypothetical protein [Planctomycetales bacterium]